jgi:hypothetical protein
VHFEALDVTIPLTKDGHFLRSDGAVADVVAHTQDVLAEFGLEGSQLKLSNPGRYGRQMCLTFDNGDACSFFWVKDDADAQIVKARLNHEKYHALCGLQPDSINVLDQKAEALGYRVDLASLEEELAATTVEVLTLYAFGNEMVFGTGPVMKAVELLMHARISDR